MRHLIFTLLFSNFIFAQNLENKAEIEIETGPSRIVELEVNNVAKDYNNSKSTPITSHGNYVYWTYVTTDNPESPTKYYIQLHQIQIPEKRVQGPYSINASYNFVNNTGEANHELRVRDNVISNGELTTNELHSAPSVGVDKDGFVHVIGGMHHGPDWEYCVST